MFGIILYVNDGGMSSARKQRDIGRLERFIRKIRRRDVPADMIDGDERLIEGVRQPLCKGYAHQKRAQKPRAVSYGYGVYIGKA